MSARRTRRFRTAPLARTVASCFALSFAAVSADALAQDAALASDASSDDAANALDDVLSLASGDGAASTAPLREGEGACEEDPMPAGHLVRVETRVEPVRPKVGDRVLITYRLIAPSSDRVEFEPDPAAFAQPANELEYARQQPDRDRRARSGPGGTVFGEVTVAVQPFKTGEVVIPRQLARLNAAGDVVRVCTPPVRFRVGDPFGNAPHPTPRDLTPPEEVTAETLRWRYVMLGLNGAFALIVITIAVNSYVRSRPKPEAPPPPPIPPWILATEALEVLSKSDLLSRGQIKEYYDQLSDIVRRYIGALRGFDALEMTTLEVLSKLKRVPIAGVTTAEIAHLLTECDLVKFARHVPSHQESDKILDVAYTIVRRSSPAGQKAAATAEAQKTAEKSAKSSDDKSSKLAGEAREDSAETKAAADATESKPSADESKKDGAGESEVVEHQEKRG